MKFETAAHQACYEKVVPWLKAMFKELATEREDAPVIDIRVGSAVAHMEVKAWGDDLATITTRSYVVSGADMKPDLLRYLLNENSRMRFGAFSVDDNDNILFEHTIVGTTADRDELQASVMAVVTVADQYDDQIVAGWGGQRALDRMR